MSKICLGISTAFFAIHLGTSPIIVGGTEAQKEKWLRLIADGKAIVAYAVTESEAGSDVANIETNATPIYDDSKTLIGYQINGTKQFISNGGYADIIAVLAKTPQGPSFFIIEISLYLFFCSVSKMSPNSLIFSMSKLGYIDFTRFFQSFFGICEFSSSCETIKYRLFISTFEKSVFVFSKYKST